MAGAYCLSFQAAYRCRHSGACCTAPWPIVLEDGHAERLRAHGLGATLTARHTNAGTIVGRTGSGACVFYEPQGLERCRVHRHAGPELLPSACRNFPRVALRDGRGLFVTLSSYCPTAASLLLDAEDISIVSAPPPVTLQGAVEGLDATNVLPPLLRAGMLMDFEGYDAWERHAVAVLADPAHTPRAAVTVIRAATAAACTWRPGSATLAVWVADAFERARDIHWRNEEPGGPLDPPIKAFLASHLFASWAAYQEGGLAAIVRALDHAFSLLEAALGGGQDREAFIAAARNVDLTLRHTERDDRGPRG